MISGQKNTDLQQAMNKLYSAFKEMRSSKSLKDKDVEDILIGIFELEDKILKKKTN